MADSVQPPAGVGQPWLIPTESVNNSLYLCLQNDKKKKKKNNRARGTTLNIIKQIS